MRLQPTIPAEVYGFSVKVGIGPYPPQQQRSHRRAMYAELRPVEAAQREKMRRAGKERILASIPLTIDGARAIDSEPNGRLAEKVARDALREAAKLARVVERA